MLNIVCIDSTLGKVRNGDVCDYLYDRTCYMYVIRMIKEND